MNFMALVKLFNLLYDDYKIKKEKQELKWKKKSIFYIASNEVVERNYRNRFLGNWFNNSEEISNFKSNLYKTLMKKSEKERRFGIKGEEGYDNVLDASVIEKSALFRDGIILGYQKAYETERKEIYEEFEKRMSPERIKQDKKNYRFQLFTFLFVGVMWATAISTFFINRSNLRSNYLRKQQEQIQEFYQQQGVCPTDSTSQDFVEWQKLWDEKFGE